MKLHISAMHFVLKFIFVCGLGLLSACDRGGDGVPELDPDFIATEDPNRFLQFLNTQVGLPAGRYTLVAGTQNIGESGSFTITMERDDGNERTFSGNWTSSDGMSALINGGNPHFNFTMPYSGGASFRISSAVDTCLYLLDSGGEVKVGQYNGDNCTNPDVIDVETPTSKIVLEENAEAYYRAIDPDNTRTTLEDWKEANGFGSPCPVSIPECEHHVIFRDTKDLGYGRDMYARRNGDGSFAVFVRNFRVNALPGLQYTTLNLDAAIANNEDEERLDNIQWHFGSNAIEFSTYPYGMGEPRENYAADNLPGGVYATNDGSAPMYAKFFTFKPDDVHDPDTTERRLDLVNLDGRGDKSMPGPCIACHGGMGRVQLPVDNDGDGLKDYAAPIPGGIPGDTQSQMQVIEVSTVTFSEHPNWTCERIIEGIHFVNQSVLSTYEQVRLQYGDAGGGQVLGYWQPEFAAELIKGWYGDIASASDPDDFTIEPAPGDADYDVEEQCDYLVNHFYDYVPPGWRPDPNTGTPPAGADELFREVVGPNCMVCHSRRGVNLGPDIQPEVMQDIDFSTYEKFISHAEQIERFIYHKGVMPLGGLNFDAFWDNSGTPERPGRAELLASHLPGFNSFNDDLSVHKPGTPFAVIAAPRNANPDVPVIVSAEGSSFADSYEWSIVDSPAGSDPDLSNADQARATFSADMIGEYKLRLVAAKDGAPSDSATAFITVSNGLYDYDPRDLRFESSGDADLNIKTVLQTNPLGTPCVSCHLAGGPTGDGGVPVYYTDAQVEGRDLYLEVLQRINFKEPIESILLRKPSGNHHYGSLIGGFDLDGNRYNYDLFLNWILQGAPR
jgi:hypothetical protein